MLTDGDDFIDTQVYNNYISSKIPVYSICIDIATSKIEDLVNDSGGYSIPLNSDDIKNGELLKAFRDIYEEEIPHEEESDDSVADTYPTVICGNEDLSVLRVLIRLLVFALYVLLCSFCMYYTMNIGTVITALITSVITTLITCLTGSYIVVIPLFVLAFWIAMTRYYPLTFNE